MPKNKKAMLIYILLGALVATTVAYAALQTTLNITGTAVTKGGSFNVYFANLSSPQMTGNASVSNVSLTSTYFTFNMTLELPRDSVTYYFDVTNQGTIDAMLSSITLIGAIDAKANNITYRLTYSDGSIINVGDYLLVGETKRMRLTMIYDDVDYISANDVTIRTGASITYEQADAVTSS